MAGCEEAAGAIGAAASSPETAWETIGETGVVQSMARTVTIGGVVS